MKLTKAQGIQTLKTFAVLAFSKEFRDVVTGSVLANTQGSMKEMISKYKHLVKNTPNVAIARACVETAFTSYEMANAYELEDISSEANRTLLTTVIQTYIKQLGWTQETFDNLVDQDFTRLKLTEKIQLMMATPIEGSPYYEGEAVVKELIKPFTDSATALRDALFGIYQETVENFYSNVSDEYVPVGKGKQVHKDLLEQYKYTQSSEYHLMTCHGLTVDNAAAFINPKTKDYHLPENVFFIIVSSSDKEEMNREVSAWIKENNYQYGISEAY